MKSIVLDIRITMPYIYKEREREDETSWQNTLACNDDRKKAKMAELGILYDAKLGTLRNASQAALIHVLIQ